MGKLVPFLLARLKEPSTWAGIAAFLGFLGISTGITDTLSKDGVAIATALATILAIFVPELKGSDDTPEDPR